jgi:hypothetical protein
MHGTLGDAAVHASSWPVLAAWALVMPAAAVRLFRWE